MMASEGDVRKVRQGKKLTKKRKEDCQVTMELPERFNEGDADYDVTGTDGPNNLFMNQSVFGLITHATRSQIGFGAGFGAEMSSDDEDGESGQPALSSQKGKAPHKPKAREREREPAARARGKHDIEKLVREASSSKLGTSVLSKSKLSPLDEAQPPTPQYKGRPKPKDSSDTRSTDARPRDIPVMERMLEAKAEMEKRPSFDMPRPGGDNATASDLESSTDLATRLKDIFHLPEVEVVMQEYPCWLLKSVLLQGYMYITTRHICFYAYMPKKINEVIKSGYLSKQGRRNPKFNRYWFRLKDDVLVYYTNPSDLYFPSGIIDLRYGISANVADKETGKDATYITVVTHQRSFHLKADSVSSAKEWVKSLQKIIFRSHNDGDSVKITLPIQNIMDVDDCQIIDQSNTCKIKVTDNDEDFAIDEYFFSFFELGKEPLHTLQTLVKQFATTQITSRNRLEESSGNSIQPSPHMKAPLSISTDGPVLEEHVRATLSPLLPPGTGKDSNRTSVEMSRASSDAFRASLDLSKHGRRSMDLHRMAAEVGERRSFSTGRRSLSGNRIKNKKHSKQGSTDSYVHSMEDPPYGAGPSSGDETQASASQILKGSDVFLLPTLQRPSSVNRTHEQDEPFGVDTRSHSPAFNGESGFHRPERAATTGTLTESNAGHVDSASPLTVASWMKAGAYPLQRAAGFLNKNSKDYTKLLATKSMGYVEKVSGMWKGGKKHYTDDPRKSHGDVNCYDEDEDQVEDAADSGDRFRDHFGLPYSEKLHASYFGYLRRVLPLYGKIYISDRSFCFRSLLPGTRTKLILPLADIESLDKEKGFQFGYSGLVVVVRAHEELFFEFGQAKLRDDCAITLLQHIDAVRYTQEPISFQSEEEKEQAELAVAEYKALQRARRDRPVKTPRTDEDSAPIDFDDLVNASILDFKPKESLRFTCLTIGSQGDVQPYIALCKGLMAHGHKTKIATHAEFKDVIERHGIEFAPVAGDPAELMRLCVENGLFTVSFVKEAMSTMRGWLDELLYTAWEACQDTDILIESPSAMCGIHIAEALQIPYWRAFSMPWTRTRSYPQAFTIPGNKLGGTYNFYSYVIFEKLFWAAIAGQINRWRKKELKLQPSSLEKMQQSKVPFLYNYSPSVVAPPLDFSDWIHITGYWFLDGAANYKPPNDLVAFIEKARDDGKKLVYFGFGSVVVEDSAALTKEVVGAVEKAGVRCILSKGWSDRLDRKGAALVEVPLPPDVFQIKSAPHDWLFAQMDATVIHGGAGTTGASLRAGIPTIIRPFFGDQFFFATRVEDLGVGIHLRRMNFNALAKAMWLATHDVKMIQKAKELGERIRSEDGVETAIQCIYRDLEYAKSLIKRPGHQPADDVQDVAEDWTFINEDTDPELLGRFPGWASQITSLANNGASGNQNRSDSSEASGGNDMLQSQFLPPR